MRFRLSNHLTKKRGAEPVTHEITPSVDFAADAEQLRQSMQARPNPDVAKGVLMVLYGCDGTAAFAELLRVSVQAEVLLSDVSAALVYLVNDEATGGPVLDDELDWYDAEVDPRAAAAAVQAWGPVLQRAKAATSADHLYALPRGTRRLAEAAEYLTELLSPRALVSLGEMLRPQSHRMLERAAESA